MNTIKQTVYKETKDKGKGKDQVSSFVRQIESWLNLSDNQRNRFRLTLELKESYVQMFKVIAENYNESTASKLIRELIKDKYVDINEKDTNHSSVFKIKKNHTIKLNEIKSVFGIKLLLVKLGFTGEEQKHLLSKFNNDSKNAIVIRKSTNKNDNFSKYRSLLKNAVDSIPDYSLIWDGSNGESGYYSDGLEYCLNEHLNVLVVGDYSRLSRNIRKFMQLRDFALINKLDIWIERYHNTVLYGDKFTLAIMNIIFAEKELSTKHNVKYNKDWIDILRFMNNEISSLDEDTLKKYKLLSLTNNVSSIDELKYQLAYYFKSKAKDNIDLIQYCDKILLSQY